MTVQAYTLSIGSVRAAKVDPDFAETDPVRCPDPEAAEAMAEQVAAARAEGDSVGGSIEILAQGVPPGWGDPVFYKLDAVLAWALMSIGAVKGVEFGAGFTVGAMRGSQANDRISDQGFLSNNAGGILGGISSGQPIVIRLAIKPTPSIAHEQSTIDLEGRAATIKTTGRHDPCLCPRIGPVAEAMTALALADACLEQKAHQGEKQ